MRPILHTIQSSVRGVAARRTVFALGSLAASLLPAFPACGPSSRSTPAETRIHRNEVRFGLSFEERMAILPALSRLRGDAQRRANEIYDPFRSKEDAIRNQEYFARLVEESRKSLLTEKKLNEADLQQITEEYQASRGANLR